MVKRRPREPRIHETVWPSGRMVSSPTALGTALSDLTDKTICELWDYQFRGDELYHVLREQLKKRFRGIKIVEYEAFGNTHGPNEREIVAALPNRLRDLGCDAVLSAIGA